jgi:signal transduction histidine kinase/CheY-like chemotaxis protein
MIELDPRSLYLALIIVHVILSGSILASARARRSESLRLWGAAVLLGLPALIALAFRGIWGDFFTKTLAILLVSFGYSLAYLSVATFFGIRRNWYWVAIPPILAAVLFSFPMGQASRNIISGVLNGGQTGYLVWVVVRQGITAQSGPRIMLAIGAGIMSVGFVWRAIKSILYYAEANAVSLAADPTTLLFASVSVLLQTTAVLLLHWDYSDSRLRAQREAALRLSANRTRFLAAASHDLRQPLQAITYILDDLRSRNLDSAQADLHGKAAKVAEEMRLLLDSILDAARLDLGGLSPVYKKVSATELFQRLDKDFSASAQEKRLRWKLFWPNDLYLHTDPDLLYSLISNLVSNAIKYTDRGGVLVAARRHGERVRLQVFDTGVGIAEKHGEHIFEEFYQVQPPPKDRVKGSGLGIGLGLFMVRRLVDLLGCDLRWRSTEGGGSVFTVDMPAGMDTHAPELMAPPQPNQPPAACTGRRVVIVEDDELTREAAEGWFRSMGNEVRSFASAESALAGADLARTELFVVDYRLEGEMTGLDLLNSIERTQGGVRGVIVTGSSLVPGHELPGCAWPVLAKPVAPADLLRAIQEQMARELPAGATPRA